MKSKRIRSGKSLRTILVHDHHGTQSMNEFVEFDYLDRKPITEAEDIYEKVFITIRDYLEKQVNTQHNLASEAARLTITQDISDLLKQNNLISKGE